MSTETIEKVEALTSPTTEVMPEVPEVPVLTGTQRQGDVLIIPRTESEIDRWGFMTPKQVPIEGLAVAQGGEGGHTHLLIAEGRVTAVVLAPDRVGRAGVITVPADSRAYLTHPEHSYLGIVRQSPNPKGLDL